MKIKKVNRPKNHNRYCGPAVISSLTGCDTNMAAKAIRKISGQRAVRGSSDRSLTTALRKFWGIDNGRIEQINSKLTLAGWLKQSKDRRNPGRVFLVCAGNHWQLISGRKYVCGISQNVVSVRDKIVKRRARVRVVYELTTRGSQVKLTTQGKQELIEQPKQECAVDRREKNMWAKARRLSKKWDIPYQDESYWDWGDYVKKWYIACPEWITGDDPIEEGHYPRYADDAVEILEVYAKHHPQHPDHGQRSYGHIIEC
jgi:hypothetical protein